MCDERLAMCDGQPRDAQRHPKLEVIPQLASSQVFLLGAEESDPLAQPSLGTPDRICFPSLDFLASKLPSSRKPPFGSTGVKAKGRVKVRGWGMVKAETGAGSRSVARTRTGAGPGPGAAPCFCRWLTTGLHHGIEPISGLFSPVHVTYCVLFVSRTSPTFVNTSSLTSVTPFKAGISV